MTTACMKHESNRKPPYKIHLLQNLVRGKFQVLINITDSCSSSLCEVIVDNPEFEFGIFV